MIHVPVLLQDIIKSQNLFPGMIFLDGTFGAGGHSGKIAEILDNKVTIIALDSDNYSLENATKLFRDTHTATLHSFNTNFRYFDTALTHFNIEKIDGALLDLGFSSDQMDVYERGLTFKKSEPLSMSLTYPVNESAMDASYIVNKWDEENLRDIITYYGEEKYAFKIAKAICEYRIHTIITTTDQLADIIMHAVPVSYTKRKIHPATKTFQALRITVNDELGNLEEFLEKIPQHMNKNARLSIISFHSLEDRITKNTMREWEKQGKGKRVHKRPIVADESEIEQNPRSRSAKLRTFEFN